MPIRSSIDAQSLPLAIGETAAHINFLVRQGMLGVLSRDGMLRH